MVRVFCIVSLALAAISAVSGHVIRRQHKKPSGWETDILQNYDQYHERYLKWGCQQQHNTTFFDKCCHPLLKGEPMSVLENLGCDDGCGDDDSSVPPSSTSSQPHTSTSAPPSPPSKPASAGLAKGDDNPPPPPSSSLSSSSSPSPTTTTPTPAKASPTPSKGNNDGVHKGGEGTFFYQKGNPGACGTVHQDSDLICAIDSQLYSQSICGKSVRITNTENGKSVTVIVADECPTCKNANSVDLSTGAYDQIGAESEGVLTIEWEFL